MERCSPENYFEIIWFNKIILSETFLLKFNRFHAIKLNKKELNEMRKFKGTSLVAHCPFSIPNKGAQLRV